MTVREAVEIMTDAESFVLSWDGCVIPYNKNDELLCEAFGLYKVKGINRGGLPNSYELQIAAKPIKEG